MECPLDMEAFTLRNGVTASRVPLENKRGRSSKQIARKGRTQALFSCTLESLESMHGL